jgi:hypothetical protein
MSLKYFGGGVMKNLIIIIIVSILVFIGFICFFMDLFNAQVYSIVGIVENANIDSEGNIIIDEENITNQPTYISYKYEGITIGLIAIKNSEDKVMVVINTCKSCEESPYSYYLLKGKYFESQSCKNKIAIDDLDNLNDENCYPINIEERKDENGKIIIGTKQLIELKDRFKNWNGPKE